MLGWDVTVNMRVCTSKATNSVHPVPPTPALPFPLKPDGRVHVLETQVAPSTQILVPHCVPDWEHREGRRFR